MDKIKTHPTFVLLIILFLLEIQNYGLNGLQIAIHMNIFPGKYKHCRFEALSKHFICMNIPGSTNGVTLGQDYCVESVLENLFQNSHYFAILFGDSSGIEI